MRIGERSIRVNRKEVERFLAENRRIDPGAVLEAAHRRSSVCAKR